MSKNKFARPARAISAPAQGNTAPYANMPANNNGTFPVSTGNTHNSKFGSGVKPTAAQGGANQTNSAGGAKMPANNVTDKSVTLGHTKHGVGEVPGYLKGK